MDKIIQKIVALGVPGLVLLIVMGTSGYAGAAAIVSSLALLGGPFGMIGGIAALGLMVLISNSIAKYGFEKIMKGVVVGLKEKGKSKNDIKIEIDSYWTLTNDLKEKLKKYVDSY